MTLLPLASNAAGHNKLDDHIQSKPTRPEALGIDHRQNQPHALKVEYSARERIEKHIKGLSNDRIPKKNNGSLSRMKQEGSSTKGASRAFGSLCALAQA